VEASGARMPTRSAVINAVRRVNFTASQTVTGPLYFTATGERRSSPMFVVEINPQNLQPTVIFGDRHLATR